MVYQLFQNMILFADEFCSENSRVPEPKKKTKNVGIIVGCILAALVGITLSIFIIKRYSMKMKSWTIIRV